MAIETQAHEERAQILSMTIRCPQGHESGITDFSLATEGGDFGCTATLEVCCAECGEWYEAKSSL